MRIWAWLATLGSWIFEKMPQELLMLPDGVLLSGELLDMSELSFFWFKINYFWDLFLQLNFNKSKIKRLNYNSFIEKKHHSFVGVGPSRRRRVFARAEFDVTPMSSARLVRRGRVVIRYHLAWSGGGARRPTPDGNFHVEGGLLRFNARGRTQESSLAYNKKRLFNNQKQCT